MNIIDKAKQYINAGLSIIPTKADNIPALIAWKRYQIDLMDEGEAQLLFSGGEVRGLGILCGAVSGNLEVIDVNSKYDLTGNLWTELKSLIDEHFPEQKSIGLVIARTKNKGYHIYYRSKEIEDSINLASRFTTNEEKEETHKKLIAKGELAEQAEKQGKNDKLRVLLETRGEGTYVIADPTPGYEFIQGDPLTIPTITKEDRNLLFNLARSFSEIPDLDPKQTTYIKSSINVIYGYSPFEDCNQRADIIELLQNYGWAVVNRTVDRVYLRRPGATDSKTSASYHKGLKTFYVFSTLTNFETGKGYNPAGVFCVLECNGDYNLASKKLYELGYGERRDSKTKQKFTQIEINNIRIEGIKKTSEIFPLAKPGDLLKVEKVISGEPEKIYVYYVSLDDSEEILKTLTFFDNVIEARVYLTQVDDLDTLTNKQSSQHPYEFRLHMLSKHYGELEKAKGSLDAEDIDKLLSDTVIIASSLRQPTDRDHFAALFTSLDSIKNLGVTEESFKAIEEELRYKTEQEKKNNSLVKILDTSYEIREQGDVKGVLTYLEESLQNLKKESGKELLPTALSSDNLFTQIGETAPAFKSGYKSLDRFIGFTPGALSVIAGRPSHGKTTLMFNLLLEMSQRYGLDYKFYYFTYEEPLKNLSIKLLNRLIGHDLSRHYNSITAPTSPTNYEFLRAYIKAKRTDIPEIETGKELFSNLIDSGVITIIDCNYSVEELGSLIAYVTQREKIGVVFIDSLQRIRTERRTQEKRTEKSHISNQFLQIAKENNLPIILGSQLNRSNFTGEINKPTLENLMEAGNLEENANTVISVYNESRDKDESSNGASYANEREIDLEVKTLKNREGEVNQATLLTFDKWTGIIKEKTAAATHL